MKKITILSILAMLIIVASSVCAFSMDPVEPSPLTSLQGTAASVLGTMQWVGYVVAVGMLIWVGIKYVTSGAGEKAKAKETLVPIVIGAVLIAAATAIATAVFTAIG